ncbi:XtrA/YqaO family protein [Heyndrickxia oleronia]|uniref:XtrA/YqaO family protein n=1 Tax=Heyndrickxia oleronia TaxID=38875 RepID=UPI001C0F2077|nr:XtrA/YqaO family protein [Heyndrickxia oleronia]MBU5212480.1 XtrA/YqaO family protein [Heyndrickxia oleronia]
MSLKDIEINPITIRIEVDIKTQSNSFLIVVCDGKARITNLPHYGEAKIITRQEKVKRVKFDKGEDF